MSGLHDVPKRVKWPVDLPSQTRLQDALHEHHLEARIKIMRALDDRADTRLYNAARRMAFCGTGARFAMDVDHRHIVPFITRCRHPMCPFCSRKRTSVVATQIKDLMTHMPTPRHIVLTVKSRTTPLALQLQDLRRWFAKLRRSKLWKQNVIGGVYTVETTIEKDSGLWHPHLHIIYDGKYMPVKALQHVWHAITGNSFIVWIAQVYDRAGAANELAKYIGKPQKVEQWTIDQVKQYAIAIIHSRMVQTFGNCHGKKVEDKDEIERIPEDAFRSSLSRIVWLAKLGYGTPADIMLLIAARWKYLSSYLLNELGNIERPDEPTGNEKPEELDARLFAVFEKYKMETDTFLYTEIAGAEMSC